MRMLALVLLATSCLAQDVPQDVSAVKISSGGTVHGHAQWRNDVLYVDNGGKMLLTFGKAEVVSVQVVTGDEADVLREEIERRRAFAATVSRGTAPAPPHQKPKTRSTPSGNEQKEAEQPVDAKMNELVKQANEIMKEMTKNGTLRKLDSDSGTFWLNPLTWSQMDRDEKENILWVFVVFKNSKQMSKSARASVRALSYKDDSVLGETVVGWFDMEFKIYK